MTMIIGSHLFPPNCKISQTSNRSNESCWEVSKYSRCTFGLLTKERSREIDDRFPFCINLEGGENHVKLLADQCTHQAVPFTVLKSQDYRPVIIISTQLLYIALGLDPGNIMRNHIKEKPLTAN